MSDLDQLFDTLVGNVRSQTRAPGASMAIAQARRRRKTAAAAGTVAVAVLIAAGSVLAAGTLGGAEGRSSLAGPPTPSPETPAETARAAAGEPYRILRETLTSAPDWTMTDAAVADAPSLDRCGEWSEGAGGAGANLGLSGHLEAPTFGWSATELEGFPSPARAKRAMDRLVDVLASCTAQSWTVQPIGQTGAVLAVTDAGVVWIHQKDRSVATLAIATTDGPPPLAVQVEVADLIYSWFCTACDD